MTNDFENKIKKKEDEINDLKKKIEEMSAEFAKMLKVKTNFHFKDTLDKMQERIDLVQWDNDSDP
jgi:regulator of replication initiation timing